MSNVLSRSNNPTGIRLPKSKAARFYSADNPGFAFGESTVVGNTPGGFVEFGDKKSGAKAALHDYGVKKDKGFTLGQFIEAHTSGDSTGIANHKINIPAILKKDGIDVNLDTLMSDIPTGALMNAVTQSEGGLENRAQFEPVFANILADTATVDDSLVRNLTEEPSTGEQFTPLSSEELAKMTPEERNAYNNRAMDAWSKSSKSFSDLTGDKSTDQTDPITKRLTADSYRDNPNVSIPASVRNSMDFQTVGGGRMFERFPKMSIRPTPTAGQPTSPVTDELPPGSKVPTEPFGSIDKVEVEPVDIETPENTIENKLIETKVERGDEEAVAVPTFTDEEEVEQPQQSMLARLGKAVRDNPEMALAGTRSIGSLLAAIGQGRGQRKEDERVRQATGRSNLISALTSGRVTPGVSKEQPDIGLLGRIGQGLAVAGETGMEALKQRDVQKLKQDELTRKIRRDAVTAARTAALNNLTAEQINKSIFDATMDMTEAEAREYERYYRRGLAQQGQDLDLAKFKLSQKALDWKNIWQNADMQAEQWAQARRDEFFKLSVEDKNRAYELSKERLNLDKTKTDAYVRKADAYVQKLKNEADEALKAVYGDRYKNFRDIVTEANKEISGFLADERGTLKIYTGLTAAFEDFDKNPNAANSTAIFNFYQQMIDAATVREGDLNLQERAQGFQQELAAFFERARGVGHVLSNTQLRRMKRLGDALYKDLAGKARGRLNAYLSEAVPPEERASFDRYYDRLFGTPSQIEQDTGVKVTNAPIIVKSLENLEDE